MQRKWKRRWQRLAKAILPPVAAGLLLLSAYSPVYAASAADATVTSGSATVTTSGATTTVTQTTNKAIINWTSFSIASGETVNFVQPSATSVALNRVTGNSASTIYGTLTANGKVYLVNPNGVLFSSTAQVNVGGLVASTLNISDSDFLSGNYTFSGTGAGSVVNQGSITATNEAVLIGPKVANEGVIAAKVVGLGAGNKVSLDFSGDSLLNVTVDTGAVGGSATNSGTITATGGLVVMSAGTADALLSSVVNNSGVIRAQTVTNSGGVIRLEGTTATNSGTLDAAGKVSGATGGTVKVLGDTVTLASTSTIDVSGDAGGGTALIGGAYQGGSGEYSATTTTVAKGATITADAITSGNGGTVVVWSNDTTSFAGTITARGGSVSGDGGSVETSGHNTLKVAETAGVNTTAANGTTGSWLLDPASITIGSGGDIEVSTLVTALGSSNVTITTGSSGASMTGSSTTAYTGSGTSGDITVASAITWSTANSLTLSAYGSVNVNAAITNSGGAAVTLRADNTGTGSGTVSFGTGGSVTTDGAVSIYTNPTSTVSTTIGGSSYSVSVNSYENMPSYTAYVSAYTSGGTSSLTAYMLVNNVYDLQYIGTNATTLAGVYAMGRDIDASATSSWNYYLNSSGGLSYYGFAPIGTENSNAFTGTFDGAGYTISGLTINRSSTVCVGLFGYSSGTIKNVGLTGVSVTGTSNVGGLVGENYYGTITNCYSTGSVIGTSDVGGLVGYIYNGTVTNCYSSGSVTGTGPGTTSVYPVGGLVGENMGGTITNCYSTGSVTDTYTYTGSVSVCVGGLVGENYYGTITNCYSTGSVTITGTGSSYNVGGLVGYNISGASITNSHSTGSVTVTGNATGNSYNVGGLVGYSVSDTSTCYSTGSVTVTGSGTDSYNVGGLVGYSGGDTSTCYSTGSVTVTGGGTDSYNVGGLVGYNISGASITNSHSTGSVKVTGSVTTVGKYNVGGLVGYNDTASIESCYSSGSVTGVSTDASASTDYIGGLVGYNTGSIKNCYSSGSVTGVAYVGGLVGQNYDTGSIESCYSTGSVNGVLLVGGLVGDNYAGGSIESCYSTGSVSGNYYVGGLVGDNYDSSIESCYSTGSVTGTGVINSVYYSVGGLVGMNYGSGSIESCYSTGSVTDTHTGTGTGVSYVGGLVGWNSGGISNCYSTGSITGTASDYIGGLVGYNEGSIASCYSTGSVTGSYTVGGLVGYNDSSGGITNCYWDKQTSGTTTAIGDGTTTGSNISVTPLTTAQLMEKLQTGFDSSVWGIINGTSYPYLLWRYPTTPQVVSGTLSTAGLGYTISLVNAGTVLASTGTGANGFYYFLLDNGTIATTGAVLAYVNGSSVTGSAVSAISAANASLTGLNITTGAVTVSSSGALDITGLLTTAIGSLTDSDILYSVSGSAVTVSGALSVTATGAVTQSGALAVTGTTTLAASGNNITLDNSGNSLAGAISITSGNAVTLYNDCATTISAVSAAGDVVINVTTGDLTLTSGATVASSGGNVTLATAANFTNNSTGSAITVGSGKRWLIYTAGPTGSSYNGLDTGYAFTQYGTSYGDTVAGTGNGLIYSSALTLTGSLTGTVAKTYDGTTAATVTSDNVSISGLTGASCSVSVGSGSTYETVNVGSGIMVTAGSVSVSSVTDSGGKPVYGYSFDGSAVSGNVGSISTAALTVTAADASKTYGQTATFSAYTVSGLVSGDSVSSVTLASDGAAATASAGSYAITASGATGSGLDNYTITYLPGTLTVNKAALTITASDASKTYGQTATLSYAVSDLFNGDSVSSVDLTSTGMATAANVGSYGITASNASGTGLGNYSITYVGGTLTVDKAALTITASNATKAYGQTATLSGYSVSGLVNGDGVSGVTLTSAGAAVTASIGSYAITASDAGGSGLSNYSIIYVNGVLTVRPITDAAYTGAVVSAGGSAASLAGPGPAGGPNRFNGYGGVTVGYTGDGSGCGVLPLTIVPPGVNTSGCVPLTILSGSGQPDN